MGRSSQGSALIEVLSEARELGFLGPGPVEPHVEHAEGFALAWLDAGGDVDGPGLAVDLGSGGGMPALPLALRWSASRWVLVESSERRAAFLATAVARLSLADRVEVRRERAEVVGRDEQARAVAQLVTARGFGPPPVTAECSAPLLGVGGRLVVSEPPEDLDRWPAAGTSLVGLGPVALVGTPVGRFAVLVQEDPCPERFPRRVGVPRKRPLF